MNLFLLTGVHEGRPANAGGAATAGLSSALAVLAAMAKMHELDISPDVFRRVQQQLTQVRFVRC